MQPGAEEVDLARQIRDGDREAFRRFFDRHYDVLYRHLRRQGVPEAVCEDLMQNAFLYIWERRDEIDPERSLRAFLFRICRTRALNHFRDTAKFSEAETDIEPVDDEAPDEHVAVRMAQDRLRDAVATLPERRRAVFELCFMDELTYREAADVLGISVKTVENQMGHALKHLREVLAPYR